MPTEDCIRLQDAQPAPPARPETGQANLRQAVRLPKAETTWRALLQDGDLMAEGNDLSLQSGAGPKRRSDQSQKSDEKWSHRRNDDHLTNGENLHFQSGRGFRYPQRRRVAMIAFGRVIASSFCLQQHRRKALDEKNPQRGCNLPNLIIADWLQSSFHREFAYRWVCQ
jgi:hypothetical protein